jgi:integrase
MKQQKSSVSALPKRTEPAIQSNSDIRSRQPRNKRYFIPVAGQTGLRLKVETSGTKVFITHAKGPEGSNRSITIGKFPEYDLAAAKKQHAINFQAITQGRDLKLEADRAAQSQQRTATLETAFVTLCRNRADQIFKQGGMTERTHELERNTITNIEKVLGKTRLIDLNEPALIKLRDQYIDQWASLDRIKKMLIKVYGSLDRFTQEDLGFDLAHRTGTIFGKIRAKKRPDHYIPLKDLGLFWAGFLSAKSSQVKKDAYLMMLLTGERKDAVLNLRWSHVHLNHSVPFIAFQSKSSNGQKNLNAVPIVGFIGLLLKRLQKSQDSEFVFPSNRGSKSGALTDVRDLYNEIRDLTALQYLAPHDLRRTLAHVARDAMALTAYADEHILHSSSHYSGSTGNYLAPNATEFTQRRADTFKQTHSHLDDLVIASGTCLNLPTCPFEIEINKTLVRISELNELSDKILSPIGTWCDGSNLPVPIVKRNLAQSKIKSIKGIASVESANRPKNFITDL